MVMLSADKLATWCRGEWVPGAPVSVQGVSHDTRTLQRGALYFALRGERFDGHAFLDAAFARGASGAVVGRDANLASGGQRPLLMVDDTSDALQAIAAAYRRTLQAEMIVVTGSAGKTTTKEMIADLLSTVMPTARTKGNWNNAVGVPLSVLGMTRADGAGVFEVGMNHPGELAPLCQILLPDWGVVTNIGPVHIEFFESVQAIAEEKAEVLRSLSESGTAVLNRDTAWFEILREAAPGRVITVSRRGDADYVCAGCTPAGSGVSAVIVERETGQRHVIQLPVAGEHNVENAMLAIAVARGHGVVWPDIRRALQRFAPLAMRWERRPVGDLVFINDAYNANPLSMRAAVGAFGGLPAGGGKWLVLGAMLELGRQDVPEHRELGRFLAGGDWAGLITVGDAAGEIAAGAEQGGWRGNRLFRCDDCDAAAGVLAEQARAGDTVLLKASRGIGLEQVLDAYRACAQGSLRGTAA